MVETTKTIECPACGRKRDKEVAELMPCPGSYNAKQNRSLKDCGNLSLMKGGEKNMVVAVKKESNCAKIRKLTIAGKTKDEIVKLVKGVALSTINTQMNQAKKVKK